MQDMLNDAVKLKQAQIEQARTRWNTWPTFLQNTLFHTEAQQEGRLMGRDQADPAAVGAALDRSAALRAEGNAAFTAKDYGKALLKYEESVGVFNYVFARRPDWKERGLTDDDVDLVTWPVEGAPFGGRTVAKHLASVLSNIALCATRLEEFGNASAAAQRALEYDPVNLKAAFRLATALTTPVTATAIHTDRAVAALRAVLQRADAADVDPEQQAECARLLQTLEVEKCDNDAKGRRMFTKAFDGSAASQQEQSEADATASRQQQREAVITGAAPVDDADASDPSLPPIYRDCRQGWRVVAQLREAAEVRRRQGDLDGRDESFAKASKMQSELVAVCAGKIFTEGMQPALATSPELLRSPEGVDPLRLAANPHLNNSRRMLKLLGFDQSAIDTMCTAATMPTQRASTPDAVVTKEEELMVLLDLKCRAAFCVQDVNALRPIDAWCIAAAGGAVPLTRAPPEAKDDAGGKASKTTWAHTALSELRNKLWLAWRGL